MRERVAVFDHYLTICGTGVPGRHRVLLPRPRRRAGQARGARRRPAAARKTSSSGGAIPVGETQREYVEVLSLVNGDRRAEGHVRARDRRRQSDKSTSTTRVRMSRGEIEVSVEPAVGLGRARRTASPSRATSSRSSSRGAACARRRWRFDGSHFAKGKEVAQKEQIPGGGHARRTPPPVHPRRAADAQGVARRRSRPRGSSSSTARTAASPAEATPKVDLKVHVAGDARPERVVLIGRDIVVFGPGFKGGPALRVHHALAVRRRERRLGPVGARPHRRRRGRPRRARRTAHERRRRAPVDSELMFVYQVGADSIDAHLRRSRPGASRGASACRGSCSSSRRPAASRSTSWRPRAARRAGPRRPTRGRRTSPAAARSSRCSCRGAASAALRYRWNGSQFAKQ